MPASFLATIKPVVATLGGWGLGIVTPIPAPVWSALINATLSGDITLDHVHEFLKAKGIKTYSAPEDFPSGRGKE